MTMEASRALLRIALIIALALVLLVFLGFGAYSVFLIAKSLIGLVGRSSIGATRSAGDSPIVDYPGPSEIHRSQPITSDPRSPIDRLLQLVPTLAEPQCGSRW